MVGTNGVLDLSTRDDVEGLEARLAGAALVQSGGLSLPLSLRSDIQRSKILRELDELGLANDTIVLFASDHGDMLGSQGQRLKRKPWEESIQVPGIIRYPRRVKPGCCRRRSGFPTFRRGSPGSPRRHRYLDDRARAMG